MRFMAGLDRAVAEGKITVYYRRVILDMSKKVIEGLAGRYEKVQKGVKEIMGGRVLEHEGKTILKQGIELGKREEKINTARRLRDAGMSDSQIRQFTDLSMEEISVILKNFYHCKMNCVSVYLTHDILIIEFFCFCMISRLIFNKRCTTSGIA